MRDYPADAERVLRRRRVTVIIITSVALFVGFMVGRLYYGPERVRYYETSRDVCVQSTEDDSEVVVPAGSLLLSIRSYSGSGDLGWWAGVPVYMGDQTEAGELIRETDRTIESVMDIKANGSACQR